MNQEEFIEQFDRHYNHEDSGHEREAFEEKLRADAEFKKEYDAYLKSIETIHLIGFRNDLEKIINNKSNSVSIFEKKIWLPMAASIIFAAFALFVWLNRSNDTSESLAQAYYQPYPNIIASRGSVKKIDEALGEYSKGSYRNAIEKLNQLDPSDTLFFYKGLCYLSLNQVDSALRSLAPLDSQSIFYTQSRWYSAIALLLKNDSREAAMQLKQIKRGQFKYAESLEILQKLEE